MSENFDLNQNHYYYVKKETTPLVFVHGVGLDHKMWDPQIKDLKEFSLITYDLLGHGKTPYKKNDLILNDFSNQLDKILEHLKIDKIHLIGFSLGSLISLDFASKFQNKIDKLILIGTTYKRSEEERLLVVERFNQAKQNKPISKQALRRWFTDKYLEDNPKTHDLFMNILNKKPEDHKNFLKAYDLFANHEDNILNVRNIAVKTLVMTGSNDPGSTPSMSKELVKDLSNSRYVEIKNGKHLCSIECADDVNMNIRNFINN